MTKTPKPLYAQADNGSGDCIDWTLDDKLPVQKNIKKTINFPKNSGEYEVTVNLIDKTGRGIVFKKGDPIWVQENATSCPPNPGVNSTAITDITPGVNLDTLTFTNKNQTKVDLIYQLNFIDSTGKDVSPQLDPEFKNGGIGGRSANSAALFIVLGVTTAAVLYLVLKSMGKLGY